MSSARGEASRTLDLSASTPKSKAGTSRPAPNPTDPGVKRRAVKRQQARRKNWMVWTVFFGLSVVITGMTLGVYRGKGRYLDSKHRLASKQATLHDIKARLEIARRRFAAMSSEAGQHRTLVENGFLRDGERLMLFPRGKPNDASNDQP